MDKIDYRLNRGDERAIVCGLLGQDEVSVSALQLESVLERLIVRGVSVFLIDKNYEFGKMAIEVFGFLRESYRHIRYFVVDRGARAKNGYENGVEYIKVDIDCSFFIVMRSKLLLCEINTYKNKDMPYSAYQYALNHRKQVININRTDRVSLRISDEQLQAKVDKCRDF